LFAREAVVDDVDGYHIRQYPYLHSPFGIAIQNTGPTPNALIRIDLQQNKLPGALGMSIIHSEKVRMCALGTILR
jgi:hypothetical protein